MSDYPFQLGSCLFLTPQLSSSLMQTPVPEHVHSTGIYEVHYITSGYGTLIASGRRFDLYPGILYVTGPHIPHSQLLPEQNPMAEACIYYKVAPLTGKSSAVPTAKKEEAAVRILLDHPFWIGRDNQNIRPLLENIFTEMEQNHPDADIMISCYLKQLVLLLVRNMRDNQQIHGNGNTTAAGEIDLNSKRFYLIECAFLSEFQTITLSSLSSRIGLSTRQTQRLLQTYYGMDFNQKRVQARMAKARLLLESTDLSVGKIAEEVGYATSEHFCNTFRKVCQMTPLQYRRKDGQPFSFL